MPGVSNLFETRAGKIFNTSVNKYITKYEYLFEILTKQEIQIFHFI